MTLVTGLRMGRAEHGYRAREKHPVRTSTASATSSRHGANKRHASSIDDGNLTCLHHDQDKRCSWNNRHTQLFNLCSDPSEPVELEAVTAYKWFIGDA
jgi:hypothetical protein